MELAKQTKLNPYKSAKHQTVAKHISTKWHKYSPNAIPFALNTHDNFNYNLQLHLHLRFQLQLHLANSNFTKLIARS